MFLASVMRHGGLAEVCGNSRLPISIARYVGFISLPLAATGGASGDLRNFA